MTDRSAPDARRAQNPAMATPLQRLPMLGDAPAAARHDTAPVLAKGFRPFFLAASVFAAAMLPLWLAALAGRFDPGGYLGAMYWHAHEMVFGFAVAVLAGFLLTAAGNWTGRETATGAPLAGLVALWAAGRVAMLVASALPRGVPAVVELAFLPALLVALGRPIVAARNWRNLVMLAVVAALWLCDLAVHLDALGALPGWRRRGALAAVDVLAFVMLLMAGRVLPMFTRNATGVASVRNVAPLDLAAAGAMALTAALSVAAPASPAGGVAAGLAALLALARTAPWGARHTASHPMLWILHAGHAWIVFGLALRAAAALTARVSPVLATHAVTAGALGALTVGMMARVSLGHTGRAIAATRQTAAAFALVTLAAAARVLLPLAAGHWYRASVYASGALWTLAFGLLAVELAPVLVAPRVDGRPG